MNENIIETFDLTKEYKLKTGGKILALNKINLSIKKGEIFGLLGPNGAGKTTLVSILSTLQQPTSGTAKVFGLDVRKNPKKIKSKIGLMLGDEIVYNRMTGLDNLKFFARIYRIKDYKEKINQITTTLGINHKLKEYVSTYSRGQKLRIAISRVLLIEPEILFLDEPTAGLDPKTTNEIINIFKNLNLSILFTSHQMEVVSKLCNTIAFLRKGNIIKIDSTENFKSIFTNKVKVQVNLLNKKEQIIRELNKLDFISDVSQKDSFIVFYLTDNTFFPKLFDFLKNYSIISINEIKPSLEDVFIKLLD